MCASIRVLDATHCYGNDEEGNLSDPNVFLEGKFGAVNLLIKLE